MPIVESEFKAPYIYRGAHIQTILPSVVRKIYDVQYIRHRISLSDGDFVDLDWSCVQHEKMADAVAVLCHGLEGNSERAYMRGMVKAFNKRGIDAVSFNFRGCSGEPNRKIRIYTAGATDDLEDVIQFTRSMGRYKTIYLVGFSLGGNLVLKYGGEKRAQIDPSIKGIAAISTPCDLRSSGIELGKPKNRIYNIRFIRMLRDKVRAKYVYLPELKNIDLNAISTLKQFDDLITAPLNGFKDAMDYWKRCSSIRVLQGVKVPTLILNAADDPMLGKKCYPWKIAKDHEWVFLEVPPNGGHVGFMHRPNRQEYWHETRTVEFLMNHSIHFGTALSVGPG